MKKLGFVEFVVIVVILVGALTTQGRDLIFKGIETQNITITIMGLVLLWFAFKLYQG